MKITVKDCLDLDVFQSCKVVAGKRNLENSVRTVSVMDAADVDTAVANNGVREQVVLTSFYAMKDDVEKQAQVVKELAGCGIAALVIFHVRDMGSETYVHATEIAEAMGMPLILIPEGSEYKYADAIEQIMDKLLLGATFNSNLINNTIYHLLDFEKHNTFQAAVREAAVSNDFQLALISKDFNPILVVETRHHVTVADTVRLLQKKSNGEVGNMYSMTNLDGVITYWGTVNIDDEKYFLIIVDNDDRYSNVEITKLAEIIELAIGMWKYTPERDVKAEFIKALIRGNKSLAYSLKDMMEIKADSILSVFYAKGINTAEARKKMANYEERSGNEVLSIQEGAETYGLILSAKQSDEQPSAKLSCIDLYDDLKEFGKSVRIFHTTGLDGIEGAGDGFRLISETWTLVESVFPFKRVFSKYELVLVSNCINIQVQGGYIKKNYIDLLDAFKKEMGENKARQLLETLETFVIDAGMNSAKTSQFMGIHTNTVQYRLKKINEVLGADITGNRVIPGLTIALALKRLEKVIN
ncbi:MAG: PucR family transcriptional regulator [Eubacterium sp.]|nr:PucR family transcriptional regulator [Eubacterium sp.]